MNLPMCEEDAEIAGRGVCVGSATRPALGCPPDPCSPFARTEP